MTQYYVAGQFSVMLEEIEATAADWHDAVHALRVKVEAAPLVLLPVLADEALRLTDAICWAAVEQGDVTRFSSRARLAAQLGEFISIAGF